EELVGHADTLVTVHLLGPVRGKMRYRVAYATAVLIRRRAEGRYAPHVDLGGAPVAGDRHPSAIARRGALVGPSVVAKEMVSGRSDAEHTDQHRRCGRGSGAVLGRQRDHMQTFRQAVGRNPERAP